MITLTTKQYSWGFACGRIAVLEASLLSKDFFLSLLTHTRTEDIFRMLQDTFLRESLTPGAGWEDVSHIIDKHFYDHVLSLRADCPDPRPTDIFLLSGDYLNLKQALIRSNEFPFFPAVLSLDTLTAVADGNLSSLPEHIQIALATLPAEISEPQSRAVLDVVLDGCYLRHLLLIASELDIPLISEYVRQWVLCRALVALWRAHRQGVSLKKQLQYLLPLDPFTSVLSDLGAAGEPSGWAESIRGEIGLMLTQSLEASFDEQPQRFEQIVVGSLGSLIRLTHGQTAGPERLFGYVAERALEAYNLKLVVSGRLSRIEPTLLRQRIREFNA